jgi:hypothetical protein
MIRPNWPGLERRVSRHGKVCWYVRVGHGDRTRLAAKPGTPEFRIEYEAALAAALKGEKPPAPKDKGPSIGTLNWLWAQYVKSSAWGGALALDAAPAREHHEACSGERGRDPGREDHQGDRRRRP